MVTPISLEPPRPGDGSGICERPKTQRERYEETKQEAQEAHAEKMIVQIQYRHEQEQRAYRAFRELFGDDDG